jgi:short-subunit dehydrogenase involved in D-alanine esterification of teichoic acids
MEVSIMMIGQKLVVVGGAAGIGLSMARNAADCGAEVYIGSSNAQNLLRIDNLTLNLILNHEFRTH